MWKHTTNKDLTRYTKFQKFQTSRPFRSIKSTMYKIRRNEKFTQCHVSEVITLDPENFRTISIPYSGETESEFLKYIEENLGSFEDIWEEFSKETWLLLEGLIYPDWKLEWCSTRKWGNYWYDSVSVDESDRVEVIETTYDDSVNG